MDNRPARDIVTDLVPFKGIVGKGKATAGKATAGKAAAGKAAAGKVGADAKKGQDSVNRFLSAVGISGADFAEEDRLVGLAMAEVAVDGVTRRLRLSKHLSARLLAMSCFQWNRKSHNRPRDWAPFAIIFALESSVINNYRAALLRDCPGARPLRHALQALFLGASAPHMVKDKGALVAKLQWEFADGIPLDDLASDAGFSDLKPLMFAWRAAHARFLKDKDDTIYSVIQNLEKIKFLECSDPSAAPGTVETLAHHLITALAEVLAFKFAFVSFLF